MHLRIDILQKTVVGCPWITLYSFVFHTFALKVTQNIPAQWTKCGEVDYQNANRDLSEISRGERVGILNLGSELGGIPAMRVKFTNPPLDLGLKDHEPPHLTELKEKCSRLFKVQYSKLTRKKGNKNKIKGNQKKLGRKEWKSTTRELMKPLHLSKSRMMLVTEPIGPLSLHYEGISVSSKHKGHISNMPLRRDCSPMNHRTLSSNIYAST